MESGLIAPVGMAPPHAVRLAPEEPAAADQVLRTGHHVQDEQQMAIGEHLSLATHILAEPITKNLRNSPALGQEG